MIGPLRRPSFVPQWRSISNGAYLGGSMGSLYPSVVAAAFVPDQRILAFVVVFVAAAFLSIIALCFVSVILSPLVVPRLMPYRKQRHLVFAFAGGIIGIVLFMISLGVHAAVTRSAKLPDMSEILVIIQLSTIPFVYGALTGLFTSIDIGKRDISSEE